MTTPARKAALQWFHDRGVVHIPWAQFGGPTVRLFRLMVRDGHIERHAKEGYSLTDKGRRALHGDAT